jgi:hypothetical protein
MLLMAAALLGWIGYNLFVERLPETRGISPLPGLAFLAGLIYVGVHWVRGKTAK